MLQPDLVRLLNTEGTLLEGCREEGPEELLHGRGGSAEGNPFNFRPQRLHLHKDHELFEDGDVSRHMYLQDLYVSEADGKPIPSASDFACHISSCSAVFSILEEYEHHYNSLHRNVCCTCRRSLPTARLLDIHIQEWHDSLFTILAQRQDMYQCLVEGCGQKFRTSKNRKDHLIRFHKYPPDFRFDKAKKDRGAVESKRHQQQQRDTGMEVVDDVCESEDLCEVLCDALSDQAEHESMETHVSEEDPARLATSAPSMKDLHLCDAAAHSDVSTQKPRYSYRVPSTVCFGHGSIRGFRGRRGRRK